MEPAFPKYKLGRGTMPDFHQGLVKRTRRKPSGIIRIGAIGVFAEIRHAIDAHFQEIARHTSLLLYRPGYGGSFKDGDGG